MTPDGRPVKYVQTAAPAMQDVDMQRKRYRIGRIDLSLILVIVMLIIFGLVAIYSASYYSAEQDFNDQYYYLRKQAIFAAIGLFFMIGLAFLDFRKIINKVTAIIAIIGSTLVMVLTNYTPLGKTINGRKRWIGIAGLTFQSAEIVKLALIVFMTYMICEYFNYIDKPKNFLKLAVLVGIPTGLVAANNLSTGIIIFFIIFLMMAIAWKKNVKIVVIIGLIALFVLVGVFFGEGLVEIGFLKKYQYARIGVWSSDPALFKDEGGYQVLQGLYAIGSGGFFGKGLGASSQKLGYLPEAQNDMIFSIICEELGIFGALCLMALFAFLIYKLVKIARACPYLKGTVFTIGVIVHLSLQVILNIAVVTNSIPNTGVSLPFISYGGSSVLLLLLEMGIVLNIGRHQVVQKRHDEHTSHERNTIA